MDKQSIIEKERRAIVYKDYLMKEMEAQSIEDNRVGLAYRLKALDQMREDLINTAVNPPILLGTLPDSNKKENTMFRMQDDCFDIPAPSFKSKTTATSVGPISMALNMPPQQDPTQKGKDHLLQRAAQAQNTKWNELRKAYNLVPDEEPETFKDFIDRIKDGKITIDLTEKEQAERKFYSAERILEEIVWQDPARKPDVDGFEKANESLRQAYNDISDEIIVKTPEAGLEALRAFQAKTFH